MHLFYVAIFCSNNLFKRFSGKCFGYWLPVNMALQLCIAAVC